MRLVFKIVKQGLITIVAQSLAFMVSAQEAVSITFTSSTDNGLYCPFNSVSVTNVTRGWATDLVYPDTVLVLSNNSLGIGEALLDNLVFNLGDVYPNPFSGETSASLSIYKDCDVLLQVFDSESSLMVKKQLRLGVGKYRISINVSSCHLAYLTVVEGSVRQVVRLVNTKSGERNTIEVEYVSPVKADDNFRTVVSGEFEPGDIMRYEAQLFDNGNAINSTPIIQPQYDDETVTFRFAINKPSVSTVDVNEDTWYSATGVGEVVDDGNAVVTECGLCWSTDSNPTIADNHAISDTNWGSFKVNMSNLEPNSIYHVKSYAVNCVGISYGNEMLFETTDFPSYSIEVSANLNGGGSVTRAGNYQLGQTCTIHATANLRFSFVEWVDNGMHLASDSIYTITVNENHNIIAVFQPDYLFYESHAVDYSQFSWSSNTSYVYASFDSLMSSDSAFISKHIIGTACDGQELFYYEFGKEDGVNKPNIIIICSQHGFEKNSTYGTYYFLKDVVDNKDSSQFLNYVYNNLHLIIVPVVNPSGFNAFSYKNSNGVNLNRNWPVINWTGNYDQSGPNYSGLAPLDQPETLAVDSLIDLNVDAKLFIDFHSNGSGVLSSPGSINWLSFPMYEDTLTRRTMLDLSSKHLDSITSNFKRIYGDERPVLMDVTCLGWIEVAQQYATVGYASTSMAQRGLSSLTFEGFSGFPDDSQPFLPDVAKANSELIGNYIYMFCNYYLRWYGAGLTY